MNLLFISIAFPPKKDPESIQTARYFKYMVRSNLFSIEVVTSSNPTLNMPVDEGMKCYDTGWMNKVEIKLKENRYINYLCRKLGIAIDFPDAKSSFHKQFNKALKKISQKPDVIYSRSYPLSSSIMAYRMAKHFGVPWIFHLSDPWLDSPLHKYNLKEKNYHQKWEEQCFNQASAICLTSLESIRFYGRKYPKLSDKMHLFPNVYDNDHICPNPYRITDKLKIIYTGGLAGTRSPQPFLEALKRFNDKDKRSSLLEVIFAGPVDRKMKAVMNQFQLFNFKYLGSLAIRESLSLQKTADVLLIIDSMVTDHELAMFFPSKILEYFIAQRRIMAVTTPGSCTDRVLSEYGMTSLALNNINEISSYLSHLLDQLQKKDQDYFHLREIPMEYSAKLNVLRLSELIKSL